MQSFRHTEFEPHELQAGFTVQSKRWYDGYEKPVAVCAECGGMAPTHGFMPESCGHLPWCSLAASSKVVATHYDEKDPREWLPFAM